MADQDVAAAVRALGAALARASARTKRHVQVILEELARNPASAAELAEEIQSLLQSPVGVGVPPAPMRAEGNSGDGAGLGSLEVALLAARQIEQEGLRPTQVNQSKAAEMLGVSSHTVRKLMHAGVIRLNPCGLIPIEEVDRARIALKARAIR